MEIILYNDDNIETEDNEQYFTSYKATKRFINKLLDENSQRSIHTQDERVLSVICSYGLSKFEREGHSILLNNDGVVAPLRDWTDKEIRDAHNLGKMYIANGFSNLEKVLGDK